MPSSRAILIDIMNGRLSPHRAHATLGKDGRLKTNVGHAVVDATLEAQGNGNHCSVETVTTSTDVESSNDDVQVLQPFVEPEVIQPTVEGVVVVEEMAHIASNDEVVATEIIVATTEPEEIVVPVVTERDEEKKKRGKKSKKDDQP